MKESQKQMLLLASFTRNHEETDLGYTNGYIINYYQQISNLLEQGPSPRTCVVVGIS